jgi:DNA modification methylase
MTRRSEASMRMRDLQVETVPVASLRPSPRNPRTHSRAQIGQIADSIRTFGWTVPLLVDDAGELIAGHGRLAAAKRLGLEHAPVIRLSNLTPAQKRAYALADNKLAENAGWDRGLLALELQDLIALDPEFEITIIGFEMGAIDVLIDELGEISAEGADEADQVPALDAGRPLVTAPGDLWALGPHRLLCADALAPASYTALLGEAKAALVFTDPPYNVPIAGHVSGLGRRVHDEFAMASGEMSDAEFEAFLKTTLARLADACVPGAIGFVCMDWRGLRALLNAGGETGLELKNLCVWAKTNAGMGSLYRSQHELVAVFKNATAPHTNNVALGKHGRHRTNVWSYPGCTSFGPERDAALGMHPTVKPVALVEDAIKDCSNRGDLVLDAFAGSGTTLIAAARAGRRGFGLELDPRYVDVALRRFRALTGEEPVHVASGRTLAERERRAEGDDRATDCDQTPSKPGDDDDLTEHTHGSGA